MRSRLVLTFVGLAAVVLAIAWTVVLMSDRGEEWLVVGLLLTVGTLAAAAGIGAYVAERLSRPFRELSAAATEIGAGRFDARIRRYTTPEADELGRSLRDAASRLDELVRREQEVAVAASHELRTPITALRLSLEDLTLWKHVPADAVDELTRSIHELDRLSEAVTHLLDRRQADDLKPALDLAALVGRVVTDWRTHEGSTSVALDAPGPVLVRGPEASLQQVLVAMLGHTTTRSTDEVSVDVARLAGTVRVRVAHDDPRVLPTGVIHETTSYDGTDGDVALAEAARVAEAMGGYLGVEDSPGTCLVLLVPSAE